MGCKPGCILGRNEVPRTHAHRSRAGGTIAPVQPSLVESTPYQCSLLENIENRDSHKVCACFQGEMSKTKLLGVRSQFSRCLLRWVGREKPSHWSIVALAHGPLGWELTCVLLMGPQEPTRISPLDLQLFEWRGCYVESTAPKKRLTSTTVHMSSTEPDYTCLVIADMQLDHSTL